MPQAVEPHPLVHVEPKPTEKRRSNWLRSHQIETMKDEVKLLQRMLVDPNIQDKPLVGRQLRSTEDVLENHTPPPLSGQDRDSLVRKERELREQWMEGVPSHEEMRRSPPGAIEKHRRWERLHKQEVLDWKQVKILLAQGEDDRECGNVEMYRPRQSTLGMHAALIGRSESEFSFPSEQFKANYDATFGNRDDNEQDRIDRMEFDSIRAEWAALREQVLESGQELPPTSEEIPPPSSTLSARAERRERAKAASKENGNGE